MGLAKINSKKCVKCGYCIDVCPRGLLRMAKEGPSQAAEKAELLCMRCGHCVSVCPKGAFSLETMRVSECTPVKRSLNITPDESVQLLKTRRSVRVYKNKKVPRKIIGRIIDAARYAPTGINRENVKWRVVYDKDEVVKLKDLTVRWMKSLVKKKDPMAQLYNFSAMAAACDRGNDVILRDAPHVIVAYGHKADPMADVSCTIALSNLELAVHGQGLGACWAGFLDRALMSYPKLQKALKLPKDHLSRGSMMVGYPKYKYKRIPRRKPADIIWG